MKRIFLLAAIAACLSPELSARAGQDATPAGPTSAPQADGAPRDPTLPSVKILERLQADLAAPAIQPDAEAQSPSPPAEIDVKAIVLTDRDHGVAMLQCGEQKLMVRLSRRSPAATSLPANGSVRLDGFTIQGELFRVVDFSETSLILKSDRRTLVVQ
jgi:hypothetical protein